MPTCQQIQYQTSLRVPHGMVRGTPFPHKTRMKSQNTQNYGSIVTLKAFQIVLYMREWCLVMRNDANLSTESVSDVQLEDDMDGKCTLFLINTHEITKYAKIMAQLSHSMPSKSFSTARMMLSHEKWCQLVNRFSIRRSLRVPHGMVRVTPFPHKHTKKHGSIVTLNASKSFSTARMMLSHEKWFQLVNRFSIRRSLRVPHGMVRGRPFSS